MDVDAVAAKRNAREEREQHASGLIQGAARAYATWFREFGTLVVLFGTFTFLHKQYPSVETFIFQSAASLAVLAMLFETIILRPKLEYRKHKREVLLRAVALSVLFGLAHWAANEVVDRLVERSSPVPRAAVQQEGSSNANSPRD